MRLNLLVDALLRVAGCSGVDELIQAISQQLPWLIEFDRAALALVRDGDHEWISIQPAGSDLDEEIRDQLAAVTRSPEIRISGGRLCVPLVSPGRLLGALALETARPEGFGPQDVRFAEVIASAIATGLDRIWRAEELAGARESLQLAIEAAKIGVWSWNIAASEMVWSDRCRELLGISKDEELSYERFLEALHPKDRDPIDLAVREALENRLDYHVTYRAIWPDGSRHWIEAMGRAEYGPDGNPVKMRGIVMDITERKRAEEKLHRYSDELKRSNKELDNFAYAASHDLKSPLRAIRSLAQWIQEDVGDSLPKESQNDLTQMRERVTRMEALLESLLAYSRVGRKEDKAILIETGQLVEDLIATLDVPEKFTIRVEGKLPAIHAPRGALNRVFGNLISNSIKHHDREDGTIRISCRDSGRVHEFAIADDGPGIPVEFQERVFVMFQTLKSRDEVEGTGMGLALVKKTVETHGGRITLESQVGEGTEFRFTWPKR